MRGIRHNPRRGPSTVKLFWQLYDKKKWTVVPVPPHFKSGRTSMHYPLFTCPACERHFPVIWPEPCPSVDPVSKLSIRCPACKEQSEPYAFLSDKILCAPEPGLPAVQVD